MSTVVMLTPKASKKILLLCLQSVIACVVLQGQPFGIHYIKLLDPDLLVQIARIMLGYAPTEVSNTMIVIT